MKVPKQLISKSGDIILTLLTANDSDFIVSSSKKEELELVFGVPEKGTSISNYIKRDLEWTFCYVISDKVSNYGIIKVVPEMDEVLSFHGIGWSKEFQFSRKYFNAWYLIHAFYLKSNSIATSNCLLSNERGVKVLINTGYVPAFIIKVNNEQYKVSYELYKDSFYSNMDNDYLRSNYLIETKSKNITFNNIIVNRKSFSKRKKLSIKRLKVIKNINLKFKSQYIRNRLLIDLEKQTYLVSFRTIKIKILEINFLNQNQYHLEMNESVKIHDLLFVKLHLRKFFSKKLKGEIFVYNNHKYDILFANDYTYLGRDSFRNNSIWKLI
ncbi:MAG: hypothetical protein ACKVG7_07035 [Flavobacteriales bacterium]